MVNINNNRNRVGRALIAGLVTCKFNTRILVIYYVVVYNLIIIIIAKITFFYEAGYLIEGRRRWPVIECFPTRTIL